MITTNDIISHNNIYFYDKQIGNTTWQNLFPCLLNTQVNRDYFTKVMPEELLSDLVYMIATASVQEVRSYLLIHTSQYTTLQCNALCFFVLY